jgi:hypothetical protein
MTVPDTLQNSSAGPPPVDDDRWHALGNTFQRDQCTVGSGEISGPSHAMDPGDTGAFGSSWVSGTDSLDQSQYQSENNRLRLYMPDAISNGTGPPRKRLCLGHPINVDAAVRTQNYEDQTAIVESLTSIADQGHLHSGQRQVITPSANTTSVPTTMTSFQQNDALMRQDVNAYDNWDAWDFIRDPDFWTGFEFPLLPASHTDLWVSGPPQPVNNDPPSFPTYLSLEDIITSHTK